MHRRFRSNAYWAVTVSDSLTGASHTTIGEACAKPEMQDAANKLAMILFTNSSPFVFGLSLDRLVETRLR